MTDQSLEALGRLVRETWVVWANEQPNPPPHWLTGWDELDEGQREVDMRIGDAVWAAARADVEARCEALRDNMREAVKWLEAGPGHDHDDACTVCGVITGLRAALADPPSGLREGEELVEIDEAGNIVRRGADGHGGAP